MSGALLPIVLDIAAVLLLLLFAFRGKKRGLIKTLAGIFAVILAFTLAGQLAKLTAPYISEKYVASKITNTISPTVTPEDQEQKLNPESAYDAFTKLGIPKNIVTQTINDFSENLFNDINEAATKLSHNIAYKITYAVLFVIFFILLLIVFSIIFKFINLAAKIPGINFINKTLGFLLGLILGYLLILAASYIMLKLGLIITEETLAKTHILKFIMSFNFASLL